MKLEKKFDDGFIITWNINFVESSGKTEDKCPNCYRRDCEWWFPKEDKVNDTRLL